MPALPTVAAHDGLTLPAVGFGTYQLNGTAGVETMVRALHAGYRVLDSAFSYENEGAVGAAVARSGVPRDEIVVSSKLPGRHHAADQALTTVEESLYRLGLDHLDLYLIHWPNPRVDRYVEAWGTLIEAQHRGLVRHIGVCNFLPEHLDRLERETGVLPAVNQIELHPYFQQPEVQAANAARGILTQAWAPIGGITFYRDSGHSSTLEDATIGAIAEAHSKTPAQVMLRWHLQQGRSAIPKSVHPGRIAENFDIFDFELSDDELAGIDELDRGVRNGPDPDGADTSRFERVIPEA